MTSRLPQRTPKLFGRARELERARRTLEAERHVAVLGEVGVGKTELALHVVAGSPGEEHTFVDLSSARGIEGVLAALGRALSMPLVARDVTGAVPALAAALAGSGVLVLDHCDHVAGVVASIVSALRRIAPSTRTVVTARAPIRGLAAVVLEPLDVAAAVDLFTERALRATSFAEASDDLARIEQVVRLTSRIPLVIEIVAARAGDGSLRAILADLDAREDPLDAQAAVAWSAAQLAPEEQRAIAEASVFDGGFALDALEGVVTAEVSHLDLAQALSSLGLARTERTVHGEVRFTLCAAVRAYGDDALDDGARREVLRRHARHYADVATRWARALDGPDGALALDHLSADEANLIAAHGNALVDPELSADIAARIALALEVPSLIHGSLPASLDLLEVTLARATSDRGNSALVGRLRVAKGLVENALGATARGCEDLEAAIEHARANGDRPLEARALAALGDAACARGAMDVATARYHQALELCAAFDAPHLSGRILRALAVAHRTEGRFAEASPLLERALAAHRRAGGLHGEALLRGEIGVLRAEEGALPEARDLLEEALATLGAAGDRRPTAFFLTVLGEVLYELDVVEPACRTLDDAIRVARAVHDAETEARASVARAAISFEAHDLAGARAQLARADHPRAAAMRAVVEAASDARDAAERAMRDAVGAVDIHRGHLDAASARSARVAGDEARAESHERDAHARLELPAVGLEGRRARRLLARAFGTVSSSALVVARDGQRVRFLDGHEVSFEKKPTLRRLVDALVRRRVQAPGSPLAFDELIAAGWPGERLPRKVAASRLHVSLASLEKLGFRGVLRKDGSSGGAFLDAETPVSIIPG